MKKLLHCPESSIYLASMRSRSDDEEVAYIVKFGFAFAFLGSQKISSYSE